jgi:putative chitinase
MDQAFFDKMRGYFGSLSQGHVDGVNAICAASEGLPLKHRAYMLATAWHETAHTMQPIEEIGKGAGRSYGHPDGAWHRVYDGRGLVQLTWLRNYVFANTKLHALGLLKADEDLVKTPELAMRPDVAAAIMRYGMEEGWFTGKKLSDFVDYLNMRRVINGTDQDALIAGYALKFQDCFSASANAPPAPIQPKAIPMPKPPQPSQKPAPAYPRGLLSAIIELISILFKRNPK